MNMQIATEQVARTCPEIDIINEHLALDAKHILELGCGKAELTRLIATAGHDRRIMALEVDKIQHALNEKITDLPNVEFRLAGAQDIPAADASFDLVFMFKSLHHVPQALLGKSLDEIRRVLKPGGLAYISEPVFAGDFNDLMRLFHDEQAVRQAAFYALKAAVDSGRFALVAELFFNAPLHFENFAAFEEQVIGVTHTAHNLSPALYAEVKKRFAGHMDDQGADFLAPIRVDLLQKPVT